MSMHLTLAEAFGRGRNANLDALRLLLAACVIVSHAWPLTLGPGTAEPLLDRTGRSLGGWAVVLFFFLSGLLITASSQRRSAVAFWRARIRRIFPGLGVAVLVTLLLAQVSGATADLRESTVWAMRAITLVSIEHRLSGAFVDNPYPLVLNGPLWSLFYEIAAYVLCAVIALATPRRRLAWIGALLTATTLGLLWNGPLPHRVDTALPLFLAFGFGMAAHDLRASLALLPSLGALLVLSVPLLPAPLAIPAVCYGILSLALVAPQVRLSADYSYGLYIYGWPVAQSVLWLAPGLSPASLAVLSLAATMPFAIASWHLVEHPATRRRAQVAA
ncbi:acyltransferase family protein [Falsiruegeria mediterranea]|uniref:Acyltransferase 3 domain-containing protein n=1 Tax=Falsiruegeria mediterranea M17 TaxID=1200281 RepID=A0A2R8C6E4_9RHOB|nr:acyltransferase [Falsiruegeria mediterranea]SPJ27985.1 hypothetical protein TRM7615_01480 [Falsiruegeria mediterranea M17]